MTTLKQLNKEFKAALSRIEALEAKSALLKERLKQQRRLTREFINLFTDKLKDESDYVNRTFRSLRSDFMAATSTDDQDHVYGIVNGSPATPDYSPTSPYGRPHTPNVEVKVEPVTEAMTVLNMAAPREVVVIDD
jgi:hypothetical protein